MAGKVLFVASTGGHLEELKRLRSILVGDDADVSWVTFDSTHSRSLLAGEKDVHFVPEVGPRRYFALLRAFVPSLRVLHQIRPTQVFSTGAAIALAFLPFAWLVGGRATYVESATRTDGPSVTGRLLSCVPWVKLRTQYRSWAKGRWVYSGSVFDQWQTVHLTEPARPIKRIVVTLGTQPDYPFHSLVERLQQIVPAEVEVLWQLGGGFSAATRPAGARDLVSSDELREWVRTADVVVAHAGVGSALNLFGSGRTPVLVPRSAERGEHVDEHQSQLAHELGVRGLAITVSAQDLTWEDLVASTTTTVQSVPPEGARFEQLVIPAA